MAHRPPPIHGPMDPPAGHPVHCLEVEQKGGRSSIVDRARQNEAKRMNEARKRYYQTWASKPGNLERKALARNLKREQKCMLNKYTLAEMP